MLLPYETISDLKIQVVADGTRHLEVPSYHRTWPLGTLEGVESALRARESAISSVSIRDTPLASMTVRRVCDAVAKHASATLTFFELSNCSLGDISVPAVTMIIEKCRILRQLHLQMNNFTATGRLALETAIETSAPPTLVLVFLDTVSLKCPRLKANKKAAQAVAMAAAAKQWQRTLETFRAYEDWEAQRTRAREQVELHEDYVREDISWDWDSQCIEIRHTLGLLSRHARPFLSVEVVLAMASRLITQEGNARQVLLMDEAYVWSQLATLIHLMRVEAENQRMQRRHREKLGSMEALEAHLRAEMMKKQHLLRREIATVRSKEREKVNAKETSALFMAEKGGRKNAMLLEAQERSNCKAEFMLVRENRRGQGKSLDSESVVTSFTRPTCEDEEFNARLQIGLEEVAELKLIYVGYLTMVLHLGIEEISMRANDFS